MSLTKSAWITGGSGLLGDILSGTLGMLSTAHANKENRKQWKRQVRFALHMAKNAHQYEVQDLRKAGLNPILSATGGNGATAQVPSAAPQQAADVPDFGSTLVDSFNSAAALKNAENQGKAVASQNAVNAAQVEKIRAEKARIEQEIAIKGVQAKSAGIGEKVLDKAIDFGRLIFDRKSRDEVYEGAKHYREDIANSVAAASYGGSAHRERLRIQKLNERNESLINRALESDKKEIYSDNPAMIDAFEESSDWKLLHWEEKDGYEKFIFKNKNGFTKEIYYQRLY